MANETATKAAPEAPKEAPKEKKAPKPVAEVFPTAEAAIAEGKKRDKGARRVFTTRFPGKPDVYSVTANAERAAWNHFTTLGGSVEELGKPAKAPKVLGADAILAAIQGLPEAERANVMKQMAELNKKK